jgi:uncharacterized membrane protein (DUF4010 family)
MELTSILQSLVFGSLLGFVMGLERERVTHLTSKRNISGVRTFTLVGMLGVLATVVETYSYALFIAIIVGYVSLIIGSYIANLYKTGDIGATSEIAGLILFISTYLVGKGEITLGTIIVILTVTILYAKDKFHTIAKKITNEEVKSGLQLMIIGLIILPLLPNTNFGPLDSFNAYTIWLMVVVIATISFISYLAVKIVGPNKGISISGFLGGLVSSTAVCLSFSQNSNKHKNLVFPFVFGVVIACSAMFFRLLLEISVINNELLSYVWLPMSVSGLTGIIFTLGWWKFASKNKNTEENKIESGKPMDLTGAIKFGLMFAVILFVSKLANFYFGAEGIYITSLVSGLLDTDAITVTLANLAKTGAITNEVAAFGIILGSISNTMFKGLMVGFLASRKVGIISFAVLSLMCAAGLIVVIN